VSKVDNSLYNFISRIYVDFPKFDRICRCNVELKFWLGIKWFVSLLKFYQENDNTGVITNGTLYITKTNTKVAC